MVAGSSGINQENVAAPTNLYDPRTMVEPARSAEDDRFNTRGKMKRKKKTSVVTQSLPTPALRCVYAKLVTTTDLKINPKNPNQHPDDQIDALSKNISKFGWRHPIIVSKRSGLIVIGHARLAAALKSGWKEVPVDFQDFESESEEMAVLVSDNRLSELSETNDDLLKDVLIDLSTEGLNLDLTGYDDDYLKKLNEVADAPSVDISSALEVIVECVSEQQQKEIYDRLTKEGLKCRLIAL